MTGPGLDSILGEVVRQAIRAELAADREACALFERQVLAALSKLSPPAPDSVLTIADLCNRWQISPREFHRLRGEGRIPPPSFTLGKRSPRWRARDVEAFEAGRAAPAMEGRRLRA